MVFLFLLLTLGLALLVDFFKTRRTANRKLDKSYSTSFSENDSLIMPKLHTDRSVNTSVYQSSAQMIA